MTKLQNLGGGGVISDPKNYIADFVGYKAEYFGKKRNVISKKGRGWGGGSRPFGSFPKKHPFLHRRSPLRQTFSVKELYLFSFYPLILIYFAVKLMVV